jgi:hypothetical protein
VWCCYAHWWIEDMLWGIDYFSAGGRGVCWWSRVLGLYVLVLVLVLWRGGLGLSGGEPWISAV